MKRIALFSALLMAASQLPASPWTYQGTLDDGGRPANGRYDLRLSLIDQSGTRSIAEPVTLFNVLVQNGSFAVEVDFGMDLKQAPAMKLRTEVAQGDSVFTSIGDPVPFDPKATLAGICWDTTGNVVAAGEFLGSTNNVPVEIRANNLRAARFTAFGPANQVNVLLGSPVNIVSGTGATIGGGGSNASNCGGSGTNACLNATDETFATISGGAANSVVGPRGTVGGGEGNGVQGPNATIGGGFANFIEISGAAATVSGGRNNVVSGSFGAIGGGQDNDATGSWSTVMGGLLNLAANSYATVSGGELNRATSSFATVSGGGSNQATASATTVGGGVFNFATGDRSTVAGGESNTASGPYAFVAGGYYNCAGGHSSFAGGRYAKVRPGSASGGVGEGCGNAPISPLAAGDEGSFVWADKHDINFVTTGPNQFMLRAGGGFMANTNALPNPSTDDVVFGARAADSGGDADADVVWLSRSGKQAKIYLSETTGGFVVNVPNLTAGSNRLSVNGTGGVATLTNGGAWTNASSRSFKEGFVPVDPQLILAKVAALPISVWNYKNSQEGNHMGPMAEDFEASFGLAGEGRSIATVDADGVALAAIQGLNQKLDAARAENEALKARLEAIEARLSSE